MFFENQLDVITGSFLNGDKDAAPLSYTKLVKYLRSRETVQKERHGSKKKNNFRKPNVSANHTSTASSQNCRWHLKGNCTRGKSCKFDHPNLPKLTEVCKAFLSGKCQHGSKCRRTHPANSDGNSKSPNPPKGDGTCFLCNQKGHWVAECPMKKVAASHVQAVMNSVSSFAPSPGIAPVVSASTSTAASPRTTTVPLWWSWWASSLPSLALPHPTFRIRDDSTLVPTRVDEWTNVPHVFG